MAETAIRAADGGSFAAHLELPARGTGPGLVLIQEIFGVNPWLRQVAQRVAAAGYVAMAPDLFWRLKPGVSLDADQEEEFKKGVGFMQRFDEALGLADLEATIAALRAHPASNGKVGVLGFCLGGRLAFRLACRGSGECAVAYYAVNLPAVLNEAGGIAAPLLLHIAENDKFVPPAAQAQIKAALEPHPGVTIHTYPGADHGFARDGSHAYHAASAELANRRTAEFLRRHLGG